MHSSRRRWVQKTATVFFLVVIVLALLLLGLNDVTRHTNFTEEDSAAYLDMAEDIAALGGPLGVIPGLIHGSLTEPFRGPLYPALLSSVFVHSPSAFIAGKLMTFGILFLFIAVVAVILWRNFSRFTFFTVVALLAVNYPLLKQGTFISPDVFFSFLVFLVWHFSSRGFTNPKSFLWGGVFAGLAYLTKPNGLLLFPMVFMVILILHRTRLSSILRIRELWIALLLFIIIASPLFIRNTVMFGNPFYNRNVELLWVDTWGDRYDPARDTSFIGFIERNGVDGLLRTFGNGVAREIRVLSSLIAWDSTSSTHREVARGLFVLISTFLILGLVNDPNRGRALYSIILMASFFIFFAWWARFGSVQRFLLPLLPIMLITASEGAVRFFHTFRKKPLPEWQASLVPVIFSILVLLVVAHRSPSTSVTALASSYQLPEGYHELISWYQNETTAGDRVWQAWDQRYQSGWLIPHDVVFVTVPEQHRLSSKGPDYLLLFPIASVDMEYFASWISQDDNGRFFLKETIPGYERISIPGVPDEFYFAFERTDQL